MLALAALLVSSCAGAATSTAAPARITSQPPAASKAVPPAAEGSGTGGELFSIASDNVDAAGYDATTGVMTVVFDSGGVYEYYAVPLDLWKRFVAAQPHPWSAVGDPELVGGGYAYARIG